MVSSDDNRRYWHLLTIAIPPVFEEPLADLLFELGSTGTVILRESGQYMEVGAYFEAHADIGLIRSSVAARLAESDIKTHDPRISTIPEEDWLKKWKEGFEPINIGSRLVVTPTWRETEEAGGRVVVRIDPGMAFGTGTHATTRMCLEAIEARWRGGRFLDVGTGTGILAIAAALLNPGSSVTAIDVDPESIRVANENIRLNLVERDLRSMIGQPGDLEPAPFDFIAANLTAESLIDLMEDLTALAVPNGQLVLSGILSELCDEIEASAQRAGLTTLEKRFGDEWALLVLTRSV